MISFPNAKINLGLQIMGKRADGFHNLLSFFLPIRLFDVLEILPSRYATRLHCTGLPLDGPLSSNLCIKAHTLVQERYGIPAVEMHLHKLIPTGSGLGGGSSDAAFCLRMLNELFSLRLKDEALFDLALELGSDCGFFLINQPALVEGRGEHIKPISWVHEDLKVVLLKPPFSISTAEAFRKLQHYPREWQTHLPPLMAWREVLRNDFESYALDSQPLIGDLIDHLYDHGAVYAGMTGSGSAVFGLFQTNVPHIPLRADVWHFQTSVLA